MVYYGKIKQVIQNNLEEELFYVKLLQVYSMLLVKYE